MSGGYSGDVTAKDAYRILENDAAAILVDVRTTAEWSFVGTPDLTAIGKEAALIEWQRYPSMQSDPDFVAKLKEQVALRGGDASSQILFLCRSGVRSRAAAVAATEAGFQRCMNVADGFEGPPDSSRHRGRVDGWKAAGLPWTQA